jgi:DNA processing protein
MDLDGAARPNARHKNKKTSPAGMHPAEFRADNLRSLAGEPAPFESRDKKFLHAFALIPGIGSATLRAMKKEFGSFERAWRAEEKEVEASGVLSPQGREGFLKTRLWADPDSLINILGRDRIWILTEDDSGYPPLLKEIFHPPFVLYGRGILPEGECLAVVGTRKPSRYGLEAAEVISRDLASDHIIIVSGLALGIDRKAHEAAIEAGGETIAILGSGVDDASLFPPEHRGLARRIAENGGAVVSEYPPGTRARKEYFPQRNRIIAGLSRGTIVVEAPERSGSLITARCALEENRDVFAVPGSIFSPLSRGTNLLIREGAVLASGAKDILDAWGIAAADQPAEKGKKFSPEETAVLSLLREPLSVDTLKEKTLFDTGRLVAVLSMLELKGALKRTGADVYERREI